MNETGKRVLTSLFCVILAFSLLLDSTIVYAATAGRNTVNAEEPAKEEGTKASGDSDISKDVKDRIQKDMEGVSNRMEADCAITDAKVKEGAVYASYHTNVPGTVKAVIYEQKAYDAGNKKEFTSSESVSVEPGTTPGDTTVKLALASETLPECFYAEVSFYDAQGKLINSFLDTANTKEIQEIQKAPKKNASLNDKVVYLDDKKTNYLVLADSMGVIADGQTYELRFTEDQVTISGIPSELNDLTDDQLTSLTGLVFMSNHPVEEYQSGEYTTATENTNPESMLPIIVKEGTSIQRNTEENTLSFAYVPRDKMKLEDFVRGANITVDEKNANDLKVFNIDQSANGGRITGTLGTNVTPKGKIIWDMTNTRIHVGLNVDLDYNLTMTGQTTTESYDSESPASLNKDNSVSCDLELLPATLFSTKDLKIGIHLASLFNGPGSVKGKKQIAFGLDISFSDVDPTLDVETTNDADPNNYIQLEMEPKVTIASGFHINVLGAEWNWNILEATIGLPLRDTFTKDAEEGDFIHYCMEAPNAKGCHEWAETNKENGTLSAKINLYLTSNEFSVGIPGSEQSIPTQYVSKTYKDKGEGHCPHKGWPVKVTVKNANGTIAPNAEVLVPEYDSSSADQRIRRYSKGTTDENGQITIYIPAGSNLVIRAEKDSKSGETEAFDVAYGETNLEKTIVLQTSHDVNVSWKDGNNHSKKRPNSVRFRMETRNSEEDPWTEIEPKRTIEVSNWNNNEGHATEQVKGGREYRVRLDAETKEYTYTRLGQETTIEVAKLGSKLYKVEYQDTVNEDSTSSTDVILTEMKEFSVEVKWDADAENKDHPSSLKVQLQSPLGPVKDTLDAAVWASDEEIELSEGNWSGEFVPVPAYTDDNKEISYRIREIRSSSIDALDGYVDIPVWDKDDLDTLSFAWEKIPGFKKNVASYKVDSYISLIKGDEVKEHKTKYNASYKVDGNKTTITNLAVLDISVMKKWVLLGQAEKPDHVFLMVQSRYDTAYLDSGAENPWTPVINPVSGDCIHLPDIVHPPIIGFLVPDWKIPIAIGKANDDNDWKVHFTVKKYGELGLPLEFQGVELTSALVKTAIEYIVLALTGIDLSSFLDWISFNPIDGYISATLPKAIELPSLDGNRFYSPVVNTKYSGSDEDKEHMITGMKLWHDSDDAEEKRPDSVTVHLYRNGEDTGKAFTLNAENEWTWMYRVPDDDILSIYSVKEDPVPDYESSYLGLNIINTYVGKKTEKRDIKIKTVWKDEDNKDGIRPDEYVVQLLSNGEDTGKNFVLSEENQWSATAKDMPVYQYEQKVEYSVKVIPITDYETEITGSSTKGFTVTNTHTSKPVTVEGSKTWTGDTAEDRPDHITIRLLANGKEVDQQKVSADSSGNWSWKFEGKPAYENQEPITYTITEDAVKNYSTTIHDWDVENTYTPKQTSIHVTKVWEDKDNLEGYRPSEVKVKLLADGEDTGKELSLNPGNTWSGTFEKVPMRTKRGELISYTVKEADVEHYSSKITGDAKTGFTITNSHSVDTVDITGQKTWKVPEGQEKAIPDSITIRLLANGKEVDHQLVEPNGAGIWTWSFTDKPKREGQKDIEYTISEDAIDNFSETAKDGTKSIENSYSENNTSVTVNGVWEDDDNRDGLRPESVTVRLYANGVDTGQSRVLSEKTSWQDTFTDLPLTQNDQRISYTIKQDEISDYETVVTGDAQKGYTVTNRHAIKTTTVEGSKTWKDDQESSRPKSITIRLLANENRVKSQVVKPDSEGNWTWKFENLPENEKGKKIQYTIREDAVAGYSSEIDGYNVTNTYTQETTSISVTKKWDDDQDREKMRPQEVKVFLRANGEDTDKTILLDASNNWSGKFEGVPTHEDGEPIEYTIFEEEVDGYKAKIEGDATSGFTITNTHHIKTTYVTGKKVWKVDEGKEGEIPDSITVRLYANNKEIASQKVTEGDNWNWYFDELPVYENGEKITYTQSEDAVDHFSQEVVNNTFINRYTENQTSLTVHKIWEDENDRDGIRPESITVRLLANGKETGKTLTLDSVSQWEGTFQELPLYDGGNKINYTVAEDRITGYESDLEGDATRGYTITNKHKVETTEVKGIKHWKGDEKADRPKSITIRLLADGKEIDAQVVKPNAAGDWVWKFENLPVKEKGKTIDYSIQEDAVEDYQSTVNGYDVTNTYRPGLTSVNVTKVWDDEDNLDQCRPESIRVKLLADGIETRDVLELNEQNHWKGTFENLPEYKGNDKIQYTVYEEEPIEYTRSISGDAAKGFTITNSHSPEERTIQGRKTWIGDEEENRPEYITISLLANGKTVAKQKVTPTEEGIWQWSFEHMPVMGSGKYVEYTIQEDPVEGYYSRIQDFNAVNTYQKAKADVVVNQVWKDEDNRDGIRPETTTVALFADGKPTGQSLQLDKEHGWKNQFQDMPVYKGDHKIEYSLLTYNIDGYTSKSSGDLESGFTVTSSHKPERINIVGTKTWKGDSPDTRPESITIRLLADGKEVDAQEVTPNDVGVWTWNFTDVYKYDAGKEITYSITEDAVKNYVSKVRGYDVTNTYVEGKTSLSVRSLWEDENNRDGLRPDSLTVKVLANGKDTGKELVLRESNLWAGTLDNLPIAEGDQEITYSIKDLTVDDYETEITGSAVTGFVIKNVHRPKTTTVEGVKLWVGDSTEDRPESITLRLFADGKEAAQQQVRPDASGNWNWKFENLPAKEAGKDIQYTVTEDAVANYTTEIDGTQITNRFAEGKTSVRVTKRWEDGNDRDGLRPEKVTVKLLANGKDAGYDPITLTEEMGWSGAWSELPVKDEDGTITYTVKEETTKGYTSEVSGSAEKGFLITNRHDPERINIAGTKTWKGDRPDTRPESITIRLLADGKEVDVQEVTPNDASRWTWNFDQVYKYDAGKEITYSIAEDAVKNYKSKVRGYDVTNTYVEGKTSLSVRSIWEDEDNRDGLRPSTLTVKILANGKDTGKELVLRESNLWAGTLDNLPIAEGDQEITYSIKDLTVEGYETEITGSAVTGFEIKNVHRPKTTTVEGEKIWVGDSTEDRPDSITLRLLANGKEAARQKVRPDASGNWTWKFENLPAKEAGKDIQYTVTEDAVANYTTEIEGTKITNRFAEGKTSVRVTKRWEDGNDRDGLRPEKVTVKLLANGKDAGYDPITLTEEKGWTGAWSDLPVKDGDGTITYTVKEETTKGYTSEVSGSAKKGFLITNRHDPERINIAGTKTWRGDRPDTRPESITIRLLADGKEVDVQEVTPNDAGRWTWNFDQVYKYDAGKEIAYSITEDAVENYVSKVRGYDVTNTHAKGKTSVSVRNIWDDENNKDKIRPKELKVHLLANGKATGDTLTLNAKNGWKGTFTNLPIYKDGKTIKYSWKKADPKDGTAEIAYSIQDISVKGYKTTITGDATRGFVITNKHRSSDPSDDPTDPKVDPTDPTNPQVDPGDHKVDPTDPSTGDGTDILPWILLVVLGISALLAGAYESRKKKKS